SNRQKGLLKNIEQKLAGPETCLEEDDIIFITGDKAEAERFARDFALVPEADNADEENEGKVLDFYEIGIAEIVILPTSNLVNRMLKDAGFRAQYNINVIGVRRKGEYIMSDLPNVKLNSGDVLLVQGTWENIGRLGNDEDRWVVLGQPLAEAAKVTLDYKAPLAAAIMLLMVAAMVFDFIPVAPVTAVMIAGVLMVLLGCFKNVEAAYKTINWESVVLIAAMMPMSVALQKTGASAMISHSLVSSLGSLGPYVLLAGIYFTTSLLSLFISNTTAAVLMAPIAMSTALESSISPYPLLFAVTFGASMCFASPFSTPPNALVMQAGQYKFMDYVKVGLPLQLIIGLVMVLVLPLLFPF
ncbi:MAG: anion permease, partial [Prevotella sp.]|nr:anion permease [Prevotella sp.]